MRLSSVLVINTMVISLATPATADQNYWIQRCVNAPKDTAQWTYCYGYVEGMKAGLTIGIKNWPGGHAPLICPPSNSDDNHYDYEIVNNWAVRNPDKGHVNIAVMVEFALMEAWPCK